jgi:hypothetical protein
MNMNAKNKATWKRIQKIGNDVFDWSMYLFFTVIVIYGLGVMFGIV